VATPKQGPQMVTRTVTINAQYQAEPQNLSADDGDELVFQSHASKDCSVYFNPVGVLTSNTYTPVPAGGSSVAIAIGNSLSETVDFVVVKSDQDTTGPYSITVEDGPLPMTVDSEGNCQPTDAAIPANGSLYFDYNQTDPSVPSLIVTFTYADPQHPVFHDESGNAVTSQTLNPGENGKLTAQGTPQSVSYTIAPQPKTDTGGTIKVGSQGTAGEQGSGSGKGHSAG